jgi:hypothetical protein
MLRHSGLHAATLQRPQRHRHTTETSQTKQVKRLQTVAHYGYDVGMNNNTNPQVIGKCQHCGINQYHNPNADKALDAMAHLCWKCVKPWQA